MVFLRCLVLAEILTLSYTAPKLGHLLFDPLTYEAAKFVKKDALPSKSNDVLRRFLRTQNKSDDIEKKPCLGYDFDDKLCKLLGDRIICGYNKNLGQLKDSETVTDIGNGCFIRGDRVECGYIIGPYLNPRRPPANNRDEKEDKATKLRLTIEPSSLHTTTTDTSTKSKNAKITKFISTSEANRMKKLTSRGTLSTSDETTIPVPISTIPSTGISTTTIVSTKIILPVTEEIKVIKITTENITMDNTEQSTNTAKPRFKCVDKTNSVFCYELNET